MAQDIFASNGPTTTVSSGGTTAPASGTSESWTVGSSAGFPAAVTGVSQFRIADRAHPTEIMIVTNVSGITWTVTRGAESTTPVAHSAGFTVYQALTAGVLAGFATQAWSDARYGRVFSPMAYGAAGNGTTDDTAALQNCVAAAVAVNGVVDLGTYTFKSSSPINVTSHFHMKGAGYFGGAIVNSASDIFTISSVASWVTFEGCDFTSNSGGGHIWNASNGPSMSFWKILGCQLSQNNPAKGIWYQVGGGWIDCIVDQQCYMQCSGSATLSPWSVLRTGGGFNSVQFKRMRCTAQGATAVPFFNIDVGYGAHTDTSVGFTAASPTVTDTSAVSGDLRQFIYSANLPGGAGVITAVTPGTGYTVDRNATASLSGQTCLIGVQGWNEEISWDSVTWEVCAGGAIAMTGAIDVEISMCSDWDIPVLRTDTGCGTTSGSPTVTDTSAVSGDLLKGISGPGIPAGAQITAVSAGTGYTISVNATATASGLSLIVGGLKANFYSFTKSASGYTCSDIVVRGGRSGAGSTISSGFSDFFADSSCTSILISSFGGWGSAPVVSSPAAQTTLVNVVQVSGIPSGRLPGALVTTGENALSGVTALGIGNYGQMQACTVTAAWTLTLPTPASLSGVQIGVRVTPSSTALLTLATAAGNIDGASTRIMWAGESAVLESDGTNWVKIAGKTLPMQGVMTLGSGGVSVATASVTNLPLTATLTDNTGLMCDPVTNQYITVKRGGNYQVMARVTWASMPGNSLRTITVAYINGNSSTVAVQDERYALSGGFPSIGADGPAPFAAGAYCTLSGLQESGSAVVAGHATSASPGAGSILSLTEIPSW